MGLLDLLFPKQCLGCKKYGMYVCTNCISNRSIVSGNLQQAKLIGVQQAKLIGVQQAKLIGAQQAKLIVKQKCAICQRDAIDGFTHPRCRTPYGIDRTISLWNYDGVTRKAILSLKYKFATDIAKELSEYVYQAITARNLHIPRDAVLIPIPMHWRRKNWRGFNQAEEIGKRLSQSLSLQWAPNLLIRTKQRESQSGLNRKERAKNISDVFSLAPNDVRITNKQSLDLWPNDLLFILFDDVYTTGATLKEACKVLKKSGVKTVWALTIARR